MERGHHHPPLPLVPGRLHHLLQRQRRPRRSTSVGPPCPTAWMRPASRCASTWWTRPD